MAHRKSVSGGMMISSGPILKEGSPYLKYVLGSDAEQLAPEQELGDSRHNDS